MLYDSEVDVLRILFSNPPIEESDEEKPGVIFDYDQNGNLMGLEIINASQMMDNPDSVNKMYRNPKSFVRKKTG